MLKRLKKISLSTLILFAFCFSIFYLQSCKQDFSTSPESTSKFPPEIEAIFNTPYTTNNITCTTSSCHDNSENSARHFNLVDWQKALNGSENGTMIIPYNGFWSHMTSVLNSDTNIAPVTTVILPEYHKIDSSKVRTIMNWMNNGAPDLNGNVAFTSVSATQKALITNLAADLVAVVKTDDKLVIRLVPVGIGVPGPSLKVPHYVTASSDNKYFYVSLIQAGYLEKYDVNTYTKLAVMPAGQSPAHIVISSDGNTGYVTNFSSSNSGSGVTRFNTNTMTVTGTYTDIRITGTHGMALSKNGKYLYAAANIGEFIYKIKTESFNNPDSTIYAQIDPSVPVNGGGTGNFLPHQIVMSPGDSLLFITLQQANQVRVYRASDLSFVKTINVGLKPFNPNFTNDEKYLFVCNRDGNSLSVIKYPEMIVQTTINNAGIQPHSIDFTGDGQYGVIACETLSGDGGHHPQVGSQRFGVSRIVRLSDYTILPNTLEMGSWPASLVVLK